MNVWAGSDGLITLYLSKYKFWGDITRLYNVVRHLLKRCRLQVADRASELNFFYQEFYSDCPFVYWLDQEKQHFARSGRKGNPVYFALDNE